MLNPVMAGAQNEQSSVREILVARIAHQRVDQPGD